MFEGTWGRCPRGCTRRHFCIATRPPYSTLLHTSKESGDPYSICNIIPYESLKQSCEASKFCSGDVTGALMLGGSGGG